MPMFSDLVEEAMKIFMDDFLVYGSSFEKCLENLETVLQRCQDKNLALNLSYPRPLRWSEVERLETGLRLFTFFFRHWWAQVL